MLNTLRQKTTQEELVLFGGRTGRKMAILAVPGENGTIAMNTINDVQLRVAGYGVLTPATTTIEHHSMTQEQGLVILKSGHRDCRFGVESLMGKDTCGY